MATTYSDFYRTDLLGVPRVQKASGNIIGGTYEIAVARSANDIIYMLQVPAGFKVWDGWLIADDIDTGTETLDLDVGIVGATTQFLNGGVLTGDVIGGFSTAASIRVPFVPTSIPWTPTTATDIIVTVTAAANAGGTGTLTVVVYGEYLQP